MDDVKQYSGPVPYPVITKVPGAKPNLEEAIENVWPKAQAADKPLRICLRPEIGTYDAKYATWPGVTWIVEFPTPESTARFRDDLTAWLTQWVDARRAEASVEG